MVCHTFGVQFRNRAGKEMNHVDCLSRATVKAATSAGKVFTENPFQKLCAKYTIRHQPTASRYPQANGIANSKMKNMVPVIVTPIDFKEETWDKHLKATERKINTTFNKTMGTTPLEYLYGSTHTFEGASIEHRQNRYDDDSEEENEEQPQEERTEQKKSETHTTGTEQEWLSDHQKENSEHASEKSEPGG
ncbi:hypothetical protein QE152_g29477 [Popillia japonica]|uniref:Integrase catalytic domain-containing protein n=1 Tax=Popillia japonica TaxID=7064 RepID=A0AAW1JGZ2_POPJA